MSPRRVAIVPHTHWDREWYEPYQSFRMNLVDTIDQLIEIMEQEPSFRSFLLDGQLAAVDDYLEVRPENEERLRALAASGRITMGPWYILMDEFLVSGETIVRDLQLGASRAASFGGPMEVGYLPDMFGHIAQMPQILSLAGFSYAVVWRGVPSQITKSAFIWEALDGSFVRTEYLPVGYGNGSSLPLDAKSLVTRIEDLETEIKSFLIDDLLLMNGSDHLAPQGGLGEVIRQANELQSNYAIEMTTLPQYLESGPKDGLEHWTGELRSGARANMLMGVTSNRVDVKRAAAKAERQLERRAEPYAALFLDAKRWPQRLFTLAWRDVIRNSAHDSICACSVDDVICAVLHRFAEARAIGEGIASRALRSLSTSLSEPGQYIVNPSQNQRSGIVELVIGETEETDQVVQVVSQRFALPGSMTLDVETTRTVIGMIQGPKIDNDAWIHGVGVEEDETGLDLTIFIGPEERMDVPITEVKQDIYARLGARPDMVVRVKLDQPPIRRIVAKVNDVAGYGWQRFVPASIQNPVVVDPTTQVIKNGLVEVKIDEETGTFSLDGVPGYGRLLDDGDLGDSYNYSPPGQNSIVDTPTNVEVTMKEVGPIRAIALIISRYSWPYKIDGKSQARTGSQEVTVETTIELRADEKLVRLKTSFLNPAKDHRLRMHFPLAKKADVSRAECAFAIVERGRSVEGRSDEYGLPTFPAHRFVQAGAISVFHDGVFEYELVEDTIAVTLLRSTGMLSRLGMAYRPFPAGPLTPVRGLQMEGHLIEANMAIVRGDVDPYEVADQAFLDFDVIASLGGGQRAISGSAFQVSGAKVSSIRRSFGGHLEVRVFNPSDETTTVVLPQRGYHVDLLGRTGEAFDQSFLLRPFGIATVIVFQ